MDSQRNAKKGFKPSLQLPFQNREGDARFQNN